MPLTKLIFPHDAPAQKKWLSRPNWVDHQINPRSWISDGELYLQRKKLNTKNLTKIKFFLHLQSKGSQLSWSNQSTELRPLFPILELNCRKLSLSSQKKEVKEVKEGIFRCGSNSCADHCNGLTFWNRISAISHVWQSFTVHFVFYLMGMIWLVSLVIAVKVKVQKYAMWKNVQSSKLCKVCILLKFAAVFTLHHFVKDCILFSLFLRIFGHIFSLVNGRKVKSLWIEWFCWMILL